ncbi:MAG: (d)CMP kinase [Acidobacteriota bacterium]
MAKKRLLIAIDGPSASGKSTIAKLLSRKLGYAYLDTGAMYRALAWKALQRNMKLNSEDELSQLARQSSFTFHQIGDDYRIMINGEDVSDKIRYPQVSEAASKISCFLGVRQALVKIQQEIGARGGLVAEGRDVCTKVFPEADFKFYLDASLAERAHRRYLELKESGIIASEEKVKEDIESRDRSDSQRTHSPLTKCEDSIYIDTTDLTIEEVLNLTLDKIKFREGDLFILDNN